MFQEFVDKFTGKMTIQTYGEKRGQSKGLIRIIHFDKPASKNVLLCLSQMNRDGAGIHFCVNETDGKGRKAGNIVRVRAAFVDLDGSPLDKAMEYSPSIVVESSPGKYHCYWLSDDIPIAGFSTLQKNIIRALKGDPSVYDLPRCLRAPGFYHKKGKPFMTKIIGGSDLKFTYRELVYWFPPLKVPKWSSKKYKIERVVKTKGEFKGQYGCATEGERNHYVMRRVGGMMRRGLSWAEIEQEAMKEGMSCTPPLPMEEIKNILKSAHRYMR